MASSPQQPSSHTLQGLVGQVCSVEFMPEIDSEIIDRIISKLSNDFYLTKDFVMKTEQCTNQSIFFRQELQNVPPQKSKQLLHCSLGAITFLRKKSPFLKSGAGSGILISSNLFLTSAHNMYDVDFSCENYQFKVYIGTNGVAVTNQYHQVQSWRYLQQFTKGWSKDKIHFDYALVKLKKQVKFDTFMKLSLPCQTCLQNKNKQMSLKIYGYPGSYFNYKSQGQFGKFKLRQYGLQRANRILFPIQPNTVLKYTISTLHGQSGCPVVLEDSIIAIHKGRNPNYNTGRLFTLDLFSNLIKWTQQMKGNQFQINRKVCDHNAIVVKQYLQSKNLSHLFRDSNKINSLDISKKINLIRLSLNQNELITINLKSNTNLTDLSLNNNKISLLDLTKNSNLINLSLNSNKITSIDLSKNIKIQKLLLDNNNLASIDLSKNHNLHYLSLNDNKLKSIDLSKNTQLYCLYLNNNELKLIDLSKNDGLTQIAICFNKLTSLDLSKNVSLVKVMLLRNELTAINLTKNTKITHALLNDNRLSEISLQFSQLAQNEKGYSFSHQCSRDCEIKIGYSHKQLNACNQLKDEWVKKYAQTKYNNYESHYLAKLIKIN